MDATSNDGTSPTNISLLQIQQQNARLRSTTALKNTRHPFCRTLTDLCCRFIKNCDQNEIYELATCYDPDKIIDALEERLCEYIHSRPSWSGQAKELDLVPDDVNLIALELVVVAHLNHVIYPHNFEPVLFGFGWENSTQVRAAIYAKYDRAGEDLLIRKTARINETHEKAKAQNPSPTAHKERDPDLAPATKASVFMNALRFRNDYGRLSFHHVRENNRLLRLEATIHDDIVFNKEDKTRAEQFFTKHRDLSVADVLAVLDDCLDVYGRTVERDSYRKKEFDKQWRVKKGRIIPFFLQNYEDIVNDLKTPDR